MDKISKDRRSWNMSRIRSKDTKPELLVRKYLHSRGYRYRLQGGLPGKPDILFPPLRIAIFVNGCFWHQHGCRNSAIPKSNTLYWAKKLADNKRRDKLAYENLAVIDWSVMIIWECQINSDFKKVTEHLERTLQHKRIVNRRNSFLEVPPPET